jgi:Pyruvate/2-oxoacid:ferredoxin oxidoreductase gamma subunit
LGGAAGTKISSAATLFGHGAALSGLWVTQRDDYPVTVKSGHSISELILSPDEIRYSGIEKPDLMVVLFPEGLAKTLDRIHHLTEKDTLIISEDISSIETQAKKHVFDFKEAGSLGGQREYRAIMALALVLRENEIYPLDAFEEAISLYSNYAEKNLSAVRASKDLILDK